jgi:putative hydrolase of the HAD superfamily
MRAIKEARAIFFDAVGTLIRLPRGAPSHYIEVAARHGADIPLEAMAPAFRAAWEEMSAPPETRTPRPDDDMGWWRALVERVLDHCAVPAGALDREAYFSELYSEFVQPGIWAVYPETQAVLSGLTGKYQLGIISNFDGRLRTVLAQLGLAPFFQHIVISSEVGADKPAPWIFEEALRRAGVRAGEAWHVGDEPESDWEGGARAGLHVFKLQRPDNSLRDLMAVLG